MHLYFIIYYYKLTHKLSDASPDASDDSVRSVGVQSGEVTNEEAQIAARPSQKCSAPDNVVPILSWKSKHLSNLSRFPKNAIFVSALHRTLNDIVNHFESFEILRPSHSIERGLQCAKKAKSLIVSTWPCKFCYLYSVPLVSEQKWKRPNSLSIRGLQQHLPFS